MGDYVCKSCGGDIVSYSATGLYYCISCGKLYELEKEITVTQAARRLRMDGKTEDAIALLEDHIAKEGKDPQCLRELLLMDLNAFSISEYLVMNGNDIQGRSKFRQDKYYRILLADTDPKIKKLVQSIEAYLDACDQKVAVKRGIMRRKKEASSRPSIDPSVWADSRFTGALFPLFSVWFIAFVGLSQLRSLGEAGKVIGMSASTILVFGIILFLYFQRKEAIKYQIARSKKEETRRKELLPEPVEDLDMDLDYDAVIMQLRSEIEKMESEMFVDDQDS